MNPSKPKILDFFEFIYDRQRMWFDKEHGRTYPCSNDKILAEHRFCNVYRELDRCSIHLIDNVILNQNLSLEDKVFNVIMYRRFNTPDFYSVHRYGHEGEFTLKNFGVKKNRLIKWMDQVKANGHPLFSDAYIICQRYYTSSVRKSDKHYQQIIMLDELKKEIPKIIDLLYYSKTYKEAFDIFHAMIPLTGPFLAQQYLIDLTYLRDFSARWDINSFVDVGPGARPALTLLYGTETPQTPAELCRLLWGRQELYFKMLKAQRKKDWQDIYYRRSFARGNQVRLSDIQNCLCEFRKYCHLQTDPNKKKRYYKGAR